MVIHFGLSLTQHVFLSSIHALHRSTSNLPFNHQVLKMRLSRSFICACVYALYFFLVCSVPCSLVECSFLSFIPLFNYKMCSMTNSSLDAQKYVQIDQMTSKSRRHTANKKNDQMWKWTRKSERKKIPLVSSIIKRYTTACWKGHAYVNRIFAQCVFECIACHKQKLNAN